MTDFGGPILSPENYHLVEIDESMTKHEARRAQGETVSERGLRLMRKTFPGATIVGDGIIELFAIPTVSDAELVDFKTRLVPLVTDSFARHQVRMRENREQDRQATA